MNPGNATVRREFAVKEKQITAAGETVAKTLHLGLFHPSD
jgi:hypothetical protein